MSEIQTKIDALADFTITLAALASGAGRQSTMVANTNNRPAALIFLDLEVGNPAPAAGTVIEIYLIRGDGAGKRDDNAAAVNAAYTPVNAPLLGTLVIPAGIAINGQVARFFDTASLGPLGKEFGIGVFNRTGQALGADANMTKKYQTYLPEIV